MEGESIAPTSDVTMKVTGIGSGGRRSIDPTDYMGQAFVYEEWVKQRIKDIKRKEEKEAAHSAEAQNIRNIQSEITSVAIPEAQKELAAIEDQKLDIQSTEEYKLWEAEQKAAKEQYDKEQKEIPAELRPTAGAIPIKVFALERYNKDLIEKRDAVNNAMKKVESALSLKDLNDAKAELNKAKEEYKTVARINPASPEGKEKYKDEIITSWRELPKYATGFGLGGYFGTDQSGKENVKLKDQLAANILGQVVGSATPAIKMTPQEVMESQGFKPEVNPVTGGMNYYKILPDGSKQMFTGNLTGPNAITQYKFIDTTNASQLASAMDRITGSGGKLNREQADEVLNAVLKQSYINKQNILMQKQAYAEMYPTDENKAEVVNYYNKMSADLANEAKKLTSDVYAQGGVKLEDLIKTTLTRPVVGTIAGQNIYGSKSTGEYVILPDKSIASLADITTFRQQAGKTGEYTLFAQPGSGRSLDIAAENARQWLYANLPGYRGEKEGAKPARTGDVVIDGKALPIIHRADEGEFVKLETGREVPLSIVTDLKQLAAGTGIYARDPNLRDAQLEYLEAYKLYNVDAAHRDEHQPRLVAASQALLTNPTFTSNPELQKNLIVMATVGSVFAGMKYDDTYQKWIPSGDNIAKSILKFSATPPVENAVNTGFLQQGSVTQSFKDIASSIPKYGGDPMVGLFRAQLIANQNKQVLDLQPGTKDYNSMINMVARAAAGTKDVGEYSIPKGFASENIEIKKPSLSVSQPVEITSGPARVADTSQVLVKKKGFLDFFKKTPSVKKNAPLVFGTNITGTGLEYRKTKSKYPKMNIKRTIKRKVKRSDELLSLFNTEKAYDMDKMIGNISGITDVIGKKNKLIKGIDLKPMVNVTLPKFRKIKKQ